MADSESVSVRDISCLIADVYSRYRRGEISDQAVQRETYALKAMLDAQLHLENRLGGADQVRITVRYVDVEGREIQKN
jgi:hypothetical protein